MHQPDLIVPTDEQVKRARELVTEELKFGPDTQINGYLICKVCLILLLNKDRILEESDD